MKVDFSLRPKRKMGLAILFALIFAVLTAFLGATVKATSHDIPNTAIVLWRNLFGFIALIIWMSVYRVPKDGISYVRASHWKMQLVRSVSGLIAVALYFYSLKNLPLADATLLLYTSPIFVPIVARLWYKIALHHELWWGMGIAFLGIVIALNPGKEIIHPASLIALLSGVASSIALVSLRFAQYSETPDRTLLYNFGIAGTIMLILSFFFFDEAWPKLTGLNSIRLTMIGILALVAQIALTLAARFAPMRLISPFFYFTVICSMGLDSWFWKTPLTSHLLWGTILIFTGNALMIILYPKEDIKFH